MSADGAVGGFSPGPRAEAVRLEVRRDAGVAEGRLGLGPRSVLDPPRADRRPLAGGRGAMADVPLPPREPIGGRRGVIGVIGESFEFRRRFYLEEGFSE
eukprot:COSAG01_NODE_1410_length_10411_cov_7.944337_12_plen_99_part_00